MTQASGFVGPQHRLVSVMAHLDLTRVAGPVVALGRRVSLIDMRHWGT